MVPLGPVPRIFEMSRPRSSAILRALGEIRAPPADGVSVTARALGAGASVSAGGCSPGATIQAMVRPTGTTSPAFDTTPARTPSPGASSSNTALSVSISSSGSPLRIASPSFLSQASSLPVSCAISSAGITTLSAISGTLRLSQSPRWLPPSRPHAGWGPDQSRGWLEAGRSRCNNAARPPAVARLESA